MLGTRIGGLAVAAASAFLALNPGQPIPESLPQNTQEEEKAHRESDVQQVEPQSSLLAYLPPVDAEVVDAFRPPEHVGAPGNRGLEYEPAPGQPVWASTAGEVVFAGSVARNRFVTVLHGDGLRTSYGYLGWIAVAKGDWVVPGQLVGTTSGRFFFGVRSGDEYLDPALVLSAGHVRLVPHRELDDRSRLPAYG